MLFMQVPSGSWRSRAACRVSAQADGIFHQPMPPSRLMGNTSPHAGQPRSSYFEAVTPRLWLLVADGLRFDMPRRWADATAGRSSSPITICRDALFRPLARQYYAINYRTSEY